MTNLQIKIDDDKKQKWQSFTASVNLELPHLFNSEVEAYGADEKEATENLISMLSDIAIDVNKKLKKLDSSKPSGYMLDGVPIEEFTQASKLEKPENIAIEGTARIATVITEPSFMAGAIAESMTIDGEPIEEAIKANSDSKRQPIKEQALDEFNNARQVSYGNNVQVEPLNNPETGEKARFVVRNGDDVVAVDDYVNDKYLYKK